MLARWITKGRPARRGPAARRRAALVGSEQLEVRALMATGLDPTFGFGGVTSFPFDPSPAVGTTVSIELERIAAQADGKIVAAGRVETTTPTTTTNDLTVVRFNTDGSVDTSFGTNGRQTIPAVIGGTQFNAATIARIAVAPDGKIVVGTTVTSASGPLGRFFVARLNANGSLDTSFAGTGSQSVLFTEEVSLESVAVAPNGKVVAVGNSFNPTPPPGGATSSIAVAQLNTDGTPDTTFDGDGQRLVSVIVTGGAPGIPNVRDVAVQADNRIVIAGSLPTGATPLQSDFLVVRLNTDGSNDTSFDGDGIQTIAFNLGGSNDDSAEGVAIDTTGRIVVAGRANVVTPPGPGRVINQVAIVRLNVNGSLDTSFDGDGKNTLQIVRQNFTLSTSATDVAALPDGTILVGGGALTGSGNLETVALLASFTSVGALNTAFGSNGTALLPGFGAEFGIDSLAVLANGKLAYSSDDTIARTTAPAPAVSAATATVRSVGRRGRLVTGALIAFNTALNPILAVNRNAYQVRIQGRRNLLAIRNVTYDAATNSVVIALRRAIRTTRPLLVTISAAGIAGADDQILNGGNPLTVEAPLPPLVAVARRPRRA